MKTRDEIELEDRLLGETLVRLFDLKKDKSASKMHGKPIYRTLDGTKSVIGLGATIRRMVEEIITKNIMDQTNVVVNWCNVDKLFYLSNNTQDIHHQKEKPTEADIVEALVSDNWESRFEDMHNGKKVRISDRIFYEMLCSVPPINQKLGSFYCGEPYSGNLHYYFSTEDGKRYGQLKSLEL